jgi:hypothetical protein
VYSTSQAQSNLRSFENENLFEYPVMPSRRMDDSLSENEGGEAENDSGEDINRPRLEDSENDSRSETPDPPDAQGRDSSTSTEGCAPSGEATDANDAQPVPQPQPPSDANDAQPVPQPQPPTDANDAQPQPQPPTDANDAQPVPQPPLDANDAQPLPQPPPSDANDAQPLPPSDGTGFREKNMHLFTGKLNNVFTSTSDKNKKDKDAFFANFAKILPVLDIDSGTQAHAVPVDRLTFEHGWIVVNMMAFNLLEKNPIGDFAENTFPNLLKKNLADMKKNRDGKAQLDVMLDLIEYIKGLTPVSLPAEIAGVPSVVAVKKKPGRPRKVKVSPSTEITGAPAAETNKPKKRLTIKDKQAAARRKADEAEAARLLAQSVIRSGLGGEPAAVSAAAAVPAAAPAENVRVEPAAVPAAAPAENVRVEPAAVPVAVPAVPPVRVEPAAVPAAAPAENNVGVPAASADAAVGGDTPMTDMSTQTGEDARAAEARAAATRQVPVVPGSQLELENRLELNSRNLCEKNEQLRKEQAKNDKLNEELKKEKAKNDKLNQKRKRDDDATKSVTAGQGLAGALLEGAGSKLQKMAENLPEKLAKLQKIGQTIAQGASSLAQGASSFYQKSTFTAFAATGPSVDGPGKAGDINNPPGSAMWEGAWQRHMPEGMWEIVQGNVGDPKRTEHYRKHVNQLQMRPPLGICTCDECSAKKMRPAGWGFDE